MPDASGSVIKELIKACGATDMDKLSYTNHNIRASINAIIGYSQILKESLHQCAKLDANELEYNVDQIISRSWRLLELINRITNPTPCRYRTDNITRKKGRFDENNPLLTDDPAEHTMHGKTSKSPEIIKINLDYDSGSQGSLLEALKISEQQCLSIMKAMIIRDIDAFASDIIRIGNTYQSTAITKWGQALKEHTANFNKNEIELMMQWFPEIVGNVENRQPGKTDIRIINSKPTIVPKDAAAKQINVTKPAK